MFQNQRLMEKIKTNLLLMDKMILFFVYSLVIISTIFVYSATRSQKFVMQNLIWIGLGTFLMFLISFIDYKEYKDHIWKIYGLSAVLLILVRVAGKKTLGAQRWLKIGPFQLQPSEFVKIAIIVIIAFWIVEKYKNGINNLKDIIGAILPVIPLIILILTQPDLGTTLITLTSFVFMIFLYGANMKPIWIIGVVILLSVYPVYKYVLKDYQRTRVENFLNPEKDVKGSGWHVTQSKISIGSGGTFGKGVLQGSQSRLEFLPEAQTDFIFSVISEEMGFVGSLILLLIYIVLLSVILVTLIEKKDKYAKYILTGIFVMFSSQILGNIAVVSNIVPSTGIPLPLLSYGGSTTIVTMAALGIVYNIIKSLYIEKEQERLKEEEIVEKN